MRPPRPPLLLPLALTATTLLAALLLQPLGAAAYPDYWLDTPAGQQDCAGQPTRAVIGSPHGTPVQDSSISLRLLDAASGDEVLQACPGQTYTLQVGFPQKRRALISASAGAFSGALPSGVLTSAECPNRLIIGPSQPFTSSAAMPLGLSPGVQLALPCDLPGAAAAAAAVPTSAGGQQAAVVALVLRVTSASPTSTRWRAASRSYSLGSNCPVAPQCGGGSSSSSSSAGAAAAVNTDGTSNSTTGSTGSSTSTNSDRGDGATPAASSGGSGSDSGDDSLVPLTEPVATSSKPAIEAAAGPSDPAAAAAAVAAPAPPPPPLQFRGDAGPPSTDSNSSATTGTANSTPPASSSPNVAPLPSVSAAGGRDTSSSSSSSSTTAASASPPPSASSTGSAASPQQPSPAPTYDTASPSAAASPSPLPSYPPPTAAVAPPPPPRREQFSPINPAVQASSGRQDEPLTGPDNSAASGSANGSKGGDSPGIGIDGGQRDSGAGTGSSSSGATTTTGSSSSGSSSPEPEDSHGGGGAEASPHDRTVAVGERVADTTAPSQRTPVPAVVPLAPAPTAGPIGGGVETAAGGGAGGVARAGAGFLVVFAVTCAVAVTLALGM